MLWDPKKDVKPAVDPLSVAGLVAWLETQPADGVYDYNDILDCAICRYLKSLGYPEPTVGNCTMYTARYGEGVEMPAHWDEIAKAGTFGAALTRARAFL